MHSNQHEQNKAWWTDGIPAVKFLNDLWLRQRSFDIQSYLGVRVSRRHTLNVRQKTTSTPTMKKIYLIIGLLMHAPLLKANPTNLELLQGFIENGKSLSNARGVTFQLNADMEATDEFIKTVDKDQTRRFTILSDHVIDAGRYYTLRKFSKESEWNSKFEYSWDGKRSHETNYHDGKDGIYSVSDKDTDQILALMVLEGLQFPYRIFYPESAQTELLYPTPNNLSSKISLDAVKSVVEGWKVEVDPEGGFSLSCKVSEGHSYTLSFTDNTFFPEKMEYISIPDGYKYKYQINEWLDLSKVEGMENSRYPKAMIVKVYNLEDTLLAIKNTKVSEFKAGQKIKDDQFIIDPTDIRYFQDHEKNLFIDTHDNTGIKLSE